MHECSSMAHEKINTPPSVSDSTKATQAVSVDQGQCTMQNGGLDPSHSVKGACTYDAP